MARKEKVVDNVNYLFNKYTGKDKLEEQVDRLQSHMVELELDLKVCRNKLDKCTANEKKAVASKQDAEEALKIAGSRIGTLEHELDRYKEQHSDQLSFSHVDILSLHRIQDYISTLSSIRSGDSNLLTLYASPGSMIPDIFGNEPVDEYIDPTTLHLLEKMDHQNGFVLFHDRNLLVNEAIVPPFPVEISGWGYGSSFNTESLLKMISRESSVCILLAHAGESMVGYSLDSRHLDSYEIVRSNVKSKHNKGGFSQRRFERLRDEEIVHHAEKVREALRALISDLEFDLDHLIIAGDQNLANLIIKDTGIDLPLLFSSADIRLEKHVPDDLLKQLFVSRRYKL